MPDKLSSSAAPLPLAVIGAGAAGMLAASFAALQGVDVVLVETRLKPGAKIRVSGGGRCNVLPSEASVADFTSNSSMATVRNILATWPLPRVRAYFEQTLGIPLKREASGKLFPVSNQSRDVVEALLRQVARSGARLRAGVAVKRLVKPSRQAGPFELHMADGQMIRARAVILATGGLSMPKTGSDGSGWGFARALSHTVLPDAPALVPLLGSLATQSAGCDGDMAELAGVSLEAVLEAHPAQGGAMLGRHRGDFLFTHRGYSGPVVLDISQRWTCAPQDSVQLRAQFGFADLDAQDARAAWSDALAQGGTATVAQVLRQHLPRRVADMLLQRSQLPLGGQERACELARPRRRALLDSLVACPLPVTGSEGYRLAEVTSGGVPLEEVHRSTLESRRLPGLYFAGETLDVTGRLGGFNFLWAWVTGRLAGEAAARALSDAGAHATVRQAHA